MAKLTAPIFSQRARGPLARALVFQTTSHKPCAYRSFRPSQPRSQAQLDRRDAFRAIAAAWTTLTPTERATWSPPAAAAARLPYNFFMGYNLDRWAHAKPLTQTYGITMALTDLKAALPWPPQRFYPSYSQTSLPPINAPGEGLANILHAPKAGTIQKIYFSTQVVTTGGDLDARLETVNGATGLPTGTLCAPGANHVTTIPNAAHYTDYHVTLDTPLPVAAGDLLAVVVQADAGFTGNLTLSYPQGHYDSFYSNFPYACINQGSWAKAALTHTSGSFIALGYSDGSWAHLPGGGRLPGRASNPLYNSGSSPNEIGSVFTLPTRMRAVGLWAYVLLNANATIRLYGSSTVGLTINHNILWSSLAGPINLFLPAPMVLHANTTYRLAITPSDATDARLIGTVVAAAAQLSGLEAGTDWIRTHRTGPGAWTNVDTQRMHIGLLVDQVDAEP